MQILQELGKKLLSEVTNEELLQLYWDVSRCWSNYELAVKQNMSVERAIHILREVRDECLLRRRRRLADMSDHLMWAIVKGQDEPQEEKLISASRVIKELVAMIRTGHAAMAVVR